MARHNEQKVNALLEAFQARADQSTERMVGNKKVADVVPRNDVSFTSEFSEMLNIPHRTISNLMGALVTAGLLQAGQHGSRAASRWVALEGSFKNPS